MDQRQNLCLLHRREVRQGDVGGQHHDGGHDGQQALAKAELAPVQLSGGVQQRREQAGRGGDWQTGGGGGQVSRLVAGRQRGGGGGAIYRVVGFKEKHMLRVG